MPLINERAHLFYERAHLFSFPLIFSLSQVRSMCHVFGLSLSIYPSLPTYLEVGLPEKDLRGKVQPHLYGLSFRACVQIELPFVLAG